MTFLRRILGRKSRPMASPGRMRSHMAHYIGG